jgi:hypothetical protein
VCGVIERLTTHQELNDISDHSQIKKHKAVIQAASSSTKLALLFTQIFVGENELKSSAAEGEFAHHHLRQGLPSAESRVLSHTTVLTGNLLCTDKEKRFQKYYGHLLIRTYARTRLKLRMLP